MSDSRCSGELMRVVTLKMRVLCGILRATPGDVRSESGNRGADEYKFKIRPIGFGKCLVESDWRQRYNEHNTGRHGFI